MHFLCHGFYYHILLLTTYNDVGDVVSQALLLARWKFKETTITAMCLHNATKSKNPLPTWCWKGKRKKCNKVGGDLLSHGCAVPSARSGLTSLFGMGRGDPRRYSHQNIFWTTNVVRRFKYFLWSCLSNFFGNTKVILSNNYLFSYLLLTFFCTNFKQARPFATRRRLQVSGN